MATIFEIPSELRQACREGQFRSTTSAQAPGFEQANIVVLPQSHADDFHKFCDLNPQACPLLGVGKPGDPVLPDLGRDIDIRRDLPRYRVFRRGANPGDVYDIGDIWRDDLVTLALGCSLSFEKALQDGGVNLRYLEAGENCAAYRSNRPAAPAGAFQTNIVVTFRGIRNDQVELAREITRRFPLSHGVPIHTGDPAEIGIHDLSNNIENIGFAELARDETAMFWACGVTAVDAVEAAAADLAITHAPSYMLITDRPAIRVE